MDNQLSNCPARSIAAAFSYHYLLRMTSFGMGGWMDGWMEYKNTTDAVRR